MADLKWSNNLILLLFLFNTSTLTVLWYEMFLCLHTHTQSLGRSICSVKMLLRCWAILPNSVRAPKQCICLDYEHWVLNFVLNTSQGYDIVHMLVRYFYSEALQHEGLHYSKLIYYTNNCFVVYQEFLIFRHVWNYPI